VGVPLHVRSAAALSRSRICDFRTRYHPHGVARSVGFALRGIDELAPIDAVPLGPANGSAQPAQEIREPRSEWNVGTIELPFRPPTIDERKQAVDRYRINTTLVPAREHPRDAIGERQVGADREDRRPLRDSRIDVAGNGIDRILDHRRIAPRGENGDVSTGTRAIGEFDGDAALRQRDRPRLAFDDVKPAWPPRAAAEIMLERRRRPGTRPLDRAHHFRRLFDDGDPDVVTALVQQLAHGEKPAVACAYDDDSTSWLMCQRDPSRIMALWRGRSRRGDLLRHIFERVVWSAMAMGLVKGEGFAVDASVLEANASRYHGKAPEELEWTEKQRQTRAVVEYLAALDETAEPNPDRKIPKVISPSGPTSAWEAKANKRVQFGYGLNYLIDIENAVIVDVEATPARTYDEVAATKTMINRTEACFDLKPKRLTADTAYGTGKFLGWLVKEKKITPHIPVWEKGDRQDCIISRSDFRWDKRRGV
jgi:hypothetical protein